MLNTEKKRESFRTNFRSFYEILLINSMIIYICNKSFYIQIHTNCVD